MHVAPDTNFILRYKALWDIKPDELGVESDSIIWVLVSEVIRELNHIKDRERDNSLKRRARTFLKRFEQLLDAADPRFIYIRRNSTFDYAYHNLDRSSNDHVILADLIEFRQQSGISNIAIISSDFNIRTEARSYGFQPIGPDDSLGLPEPDDPKEIEIRHLRTELDRIQSAIPKLDVSFVGGPDTSVISVTAMPHPETLPKPSVEDVSDHEIDLLMTAFGNKNTQYELECREYPRKVESVAIERWCLKNRYFPVQLSIQNAGMVAGKQVSLIISVVGVVSASADPPSDPDWPIRPRPYMSAHHSSGFSWENGYPVFISRQYDAMSKLPNIAGPSITTLQDGYRIEYFRMNLGQESRFELKPFLLRMPLRVTRSKTI